MFDLYCRKKSTSRTFYSIQMKRCVNVPRTILLLFAKYGTDWTLCKKFLRSYDMRHLYWELHSTWDVNSREIFLVHVYLLYSGLSVSPKESELLLNVKTVNISVINFLLTTSTLYTIFSISTILSEFINRAEIKWCKRVINTANHFQRWNTCVKQMTNDIYVNMSTLFKYVYPIYLQINKY